MIEVPTWVEKAYVVSNGTMMFIIENLSEDCLQKWLIGMIVTREGFNVGGDYERQVKELVRSYGRAELEKALIKELRGGI